MRRVRRPRVVGLSLFHDHTTGPAARIGVMWSTPDGTPVDTKFGVSYEVNSER